jgi:pimeloyl-ACP methyl ester carboxylesterase
MTFDGPWIPPQTHELGTPDGRVLRYCLYGPADGVPVIAHHGTPGTRWERPDVIEAIKEAGLRVLLHGRPGFGSTRQPHRVVADVAEDVRLLADGQGWEQFAVTGFSGGGPHALACAALLPERVIRCSTVAGIAPPDALGPDFMGTLDWAKDASKGEDLLRTDLTRRGQKILAEIEPGVQGSIGAGSGTPGRVVRMRATCVDGLDGWIDDYLALIRPWGFDLSMIAAPISVWYGSEDEKTTREHTEWLLANVPGAERHQYPGGHDPEDADYRRMLAWLHG